MPRQLAYQLWILSNVPESLLVTLTSFGVQPTDRAVLSRCQADEPQPLLKTIAISSGRVRNILAMVSELAKLNGFRDMCSTNLFAACGNGNGVGDTEYSMVSACR